MSALRVIQVALPLPVDKLYSYLIPPEFEKSLQVGCRVLVPFGKRVMVGYAVSFTESTLTKLKPVMDLLDNNPLLNESLIGFCSQLSSYYLCSLGESLKAALPPGINGTTQCYFSLQTDKTLCKAIRLTERREAILRIIKERGSVSKSWLSRELSGAFQHDLNQLINAGYVLKQTKQENLQSKPRQKKVICLSGSFGAEYYSGLYEQKLKRAPRQAALLKCLVDNESQQVDKNELTAAGFTSALIATLLKIPGIEQILVDDNNADEYDLDASVLDIELNDAQSSAVNEIGKKIPSKKMFNANKGKYFGSFLLWGVTGSGKTQVYLELARKTMEEGRGVLVLVPEISLTPQIVARFKSFLGPKVAVIHSKLSNSQRFLIWSGLNSGKYRAVVGARSAVFAPIKNLGLIIVDEEHESSYKQYEPAPRYHARDAAVIRAHSLGIPVVLGSATPSLESWWNCELGKYKKIELPSRISGRSLPDIDLVDLRQHGEDVRGLGKTVRAFSDDLIKALIETFEKGQKVIILQNRRGHSPWLQCHDCGEPLQCFRCDVSLVWHRSTGFCHCHMCGLEIELPKKCPDCGGKSLALQGMGTQKVEQELSEMFPKSRVLRMDRDTTSARSAYVEMVRDFNAGKYDVLLGTQSVAKGLDFSQVTLVGVINADTELNLQDFRAQEWGYQLISQVAGRAGRGELPGRVYVQTYNPDNQALKYAKEHDFIGFSEEELKMRSMLNYPPFAKLCRILVKSIKEEKAAAACEELFQLAENNKGFIDVLNPGPAPIRMVRHEYRYHIILKSPRNQDPSAKALRLLAILLRNHFNSKLRSADLSLIIDVDPQSLI
jgi:primosomal protein N' (replication factor Y) (superfamily II helicase)